MDKSPNNINKLDHLGELVTVLDGGARSVLKMEGGSEFLTQILDNMPYIDLFCKRSRMDLISIGVISDNGYAEPGYTFTDDRRYTIEGIKKTLDEEDTLLPNLN